MTLGNQAAALEAQHQEEVASAYDNSANLLKEMGDSELRANVLGSLSTVQLRLGRKIEALATMQAGFDAVRHPSPKQIMVKKLLRMPFNLINQP